MCGPLCVVLYFLFIDQPDDQRAVSGGDQFNQPADLQGRHGRPYCSKDPCSQPVYLLFSQLTLFYPKPNAVKSDTETGQGHAWLFSKIRA